MGAHGHRITDGVLNLRESPWDVLTANAPARQVLHRIADKMDGADHPAIFRRHAPLAVRQR
jgi:hypothetical protein